MVASLSRVPATQPTTVRFPYTPSRTAAQAVSILLINDELLLHQNLRSLLNSYHQGGQPKFSIVGEAKTGEQAARMAQQLKPDLILLNLELEQAQEDGLHILKTLQEFYQGKILVLSGQQEDDRVFEAMKLKAAGYVLKERLSTQLNRAIAALLAGQVYLDSEVTTQFFRFFQLQTGNSVPATLTVHLSDREQEVLRRLVEGAPNAEIARSLYITVATVKAHLTSIFEKLGVKSRSQAIVVALRLGLV